MGSRSVLCVAIIAVGWVLAPVPAVVFASTTAHAQTAPTQGEVASYAPLLKAAHNNDPAGIRRALAKGANPNMRDNLGRTAIHVAAHASNYAAFEALVKGGANVRAKDRQRYDAITIAAVNNDIRMVRLALRLGGDPKAITSPYDGTALIAAAHLGHVNVVKALIKAGAPLDHVNNLKWTALIEAVVLGDGGPKHVAIVRALVDAGANKNLADGKGRTPLALAKARGYRKIVEILETRK